MIARALALVARVPSRLLAYGGAAMLVGVPLVLFAHGVGHRQGVREGIEAGRAALAAELRGMSAVEIKRQLKDRINAESQLGTSGGSAGGLCGPSVRDCPE